MKFIAACIIFIFFSTQNLSAQVIDTFPVMGDSGVLQNVKVNAFGSQAKLKDFVTMMLSFFSTIQNSELLILNFEFLTYFFSNFF